MPNRLANAVSPYLRSHAGNPVDWWEWSAEAFAEAAERDVPVLVSIGYATCHWCHVMARESFSDPMTAEAINAGFVAIKVDREEHPDVDSTYMAAAGAFTQQLGWPLNVFLTPDGRAFFAGTYFPPTPVQGHPAFRDVLAAVLDAWTERREEVEQNAGAIATALAGQAVGAAGDLPTDLSDVVAALAAVEDVEFGGFGSAPKFPIAPVVGFLVDRGSLGDAAAGALADRMLDAMAASDLRDPVEGGFFRYATRRDWSEPHYERMLSDNAQLLACYARTGRAAVATGIAGYLLNELRLPSGAFASAQDSESTVDGRRVEGFYYTLDAASRARIARPPLDDKVLTGWNGLAIGALASAGASLARPHWIAAAAGAADYLLEHHVRADGLVRASIDGRVSSAVATLEDSGLLADGLLQLAVATGEVRYAIAARRLVHDCLEAGAAAGGGAAFAVPGGADPVLAGNGLSVPPDPSDGALPSGNSGIAASAFRLYLLSGDARYLEASREAMRSVAPVAVTAPVSFGAALAVMTALAAPVTQLVVVGDDGELARAARGWQRAGSIVSVVTDAQARAFAEAGFELYEGRTSRDGRPAAYLCRDFVCALPVTTVDELTAQLR
jgi:hypothetical protein